MEWLILIAGLGLLVWGMVLGLYNLVLLAIRREGVYFKRFLGQVGLFAVGFLLLSIPLPPPRAHGQTRLTGCKSNLKNLGTALEMYATDFEGHYPRSLSPLTPNYLRAIPQCPAARRDTYSESYQSAGQDNTPEKPGPPDAYTFYCAGEHHKEVDVPRNYPQYNAQQGVVER